MTTFMLAHKFSPYNACRSQRCAAGGETFSGGARPPSPRRAASTTNIWAMQPAEKSTLEEIVKTQPVFYLDEMQTELERRCGRKST